MKMYRSIIIDKWSSLTIAGTVFISLALIVILGIVVGTGFNEIKEGLGNLALVFSGIAFIVLIVIAFIGIFLKS